MNAETQTAVIGHEAKITLDGALSSGSISYQQDIRWHAVSDSELSALVKVDHPFQASLALVAVGAAVPTLPVAVPIVVELASGETANYVDVLWLFTFLASLVVVAICGTNAIRGKSEARKLLDEIRRRPTASTGAPRGYDRRDYGSAALMN
jgi:hypothetical protein